MALCLAASLMFCGCATYKRRGLEPAKAQQIEREVVCREIPLSREMEDRILALKPEHVTADEVAEVLSHAPAPRVFNIHGGIFPVHRRMISFSEFLVGMGYPRDRIRNPADGTYTFSCYERSDIVAGTIAWYYERDGLRAVLVGHSQGAMQAVKVLHKFAGNTATRLAVWNPLLWQSEKRYDITDPLTGQKRPVVGLQLSYVSAVGGGGLTRFLPNQWDMWGRLRKIPGSTEEFTGFFKGMDLLGGDFLGYGPANEYHSMGTAAVRNIRLPTKYRHGEIPDTEHLLKSEQIKKWINDYNPNDHPELPQFDADSRHVLWAADVWFSVKRHWVLELQRMISARRTAVPEIATPTIDNSQQAR
jgi:pimeloyl-ACP methyl ester carboxylesterase